MVEIDVPALEQAPDFCNGQGVVYEIDKDLLAADKIGIEEILI